MLINTQKLKGLYVDLIAPYALVLALPQALEPLLPALLRELPSLFLETTLDLQQAIPVVSWYPEGTVKVLVDLEAVNTVIKRCYPEVAEGTAGGMTNADCPFMVKVSIPDLNIRKGRGTNTAKTGQCTGIGIFTIVEVREGKGSDKGWGKLKSGAGWVRDRKSVV